MPNQKAWDRRAKESDPAWAAFQAYRDMGTDRSLRAVGASLGKSQDLMERWSSAHDWVERVRAWDVHLDQLVQARLEAQRVKRAEQQAALGRNMQAVAGMGLSGLTEEQKDPKTGERRLALKRLMKPAEIAQLAKAGVEVERLAEGDPTERLALEGPRGGGLEVRILDPLSLPDPREGAERPKPEPTKPVTLGPEVKERKGAKR